MKKLLTILFCFGLSFAKAQQPIDTLVNFIKFENLKGYDEGYGLSAERPIGSGAFTNIADRGALQVRMAKLENSYRWPDGLAIDFSKRSSTSGKTGIVDRYTLTHPTTKATINLFVDPYHTDSVYYIPKGLISVNAESLAQQIAPHLKAIDEINAVNDPYTDKKELIIQEMNFIAMKIGIAALVDREPLQKIMTDTQADNQLKNYLFNAYILHKFYALGNNLPSSASFALKRLKADFQKFQVNHPQMETGNIKINLN